MRSVFKAWKNTKSMKHDDFMKRLPSSIIGEGMLHKGNIYLINKAIKHMPKDGYVLEIGVYAGLSTNLILHLLKKHQQPHQLVGCDAWVYEGFYDNKTTGADNIDGSDHVKRTNYMTYIKNAYINAAKLFHPNKLPFTSHLKSDDFFYKWDNKEQLIDVFGREFLLTKNIAFCYIDGDHSYEQTRADFENVNKHLLVGGYVLIDDSSKHLNYGSAHFIKDIKLRDDFEIVLSNPNYLVKKIK